MGGGGRRWQRWSWFHVLAKKEERHSNLATACCTWHRAERKLRKRTQIICSPGTQKISRNCGTQGRNPASEAAEAGTCWTRTQASLGWVYRPSYFSPPAAGDLLALTAVSAEPHPSSMLAVTMTASSPATSESFLSLSKYKKLLSFLKNVFILGFVWDFCGLFVGVFSSIRMVSWTFHACSGTLHMKQVQICMSGHSVHPQKSHHIHLVTVWINWLNLPHLRMKSEREQIIWYFVLQHHTGQYPGPTLRIWFWG